MIVFNPNLNSALLKDNYPAFEINSRTFTSSLVSIPHAGRHVVYYFQGKLQRRHHHPEKGALSVGSARGDR